MVAAHEIRFPSMGTIAHVVLVGGDARLLPVAVARIGQLEQRWSRFVGDSEVSRHNAALASGATPPEPSSDTRLLFDRAADGHRLTSGRFDPYRLDALTSAGYRTSLHTDPASGPASFEDGPRAPQTGFDPGGIGKGLAADLVTAELMAAGASGALVGIGGDVRVRGESPEGGLWRIDIEDPRGGEPLTTVELADGAVATSSRCKRHWTDPDGRTRHHLIDPRTGAPADTPTLQATVIAAEGWQAEVLTKVAFLDAVDVAGQTPVERIGAAEAGLELVESLGAAALVVTEALIEPTSRWERFARSASSHDTRPVAAALTASRSGRMEKGALR